MSLFYPDDELTIINVTLISKIVHEKSRSTIPCAKDNTPYWLRSAAEEWHSVVGNVVREHPDPNNDEYIGNIDLTLSYAVRPVLEISGLSRNGYKCGDKISIDGYILTVLDESTAICDEPIGRYCYNSNPKADTPGKLEASDMGCYLEAWKNSLRGSIIRYVPEAQPQLVKVSDVLTSSIIIEVTNPSAVNNIQLYSFKEKTYTDGHTAPSRTVDNRALNSLNISTKILDTAMLRLGSDAYKLWAYLASQPTLTRVLLTPVLAQETINIAAREYHKALNELVDAGALIYTGRSGFNNSSVWRFTGELLPVTKDEEQLKHTAVHSELSPIGEISFAASADFKGDELYLFLLEARRKAVENSPNSPTLCLGCTHYRPGAEHIEMGPDFAPVRPFACRHIYSLISNKTDSEAILGYTNAERMFAIWARMNHSLSNGIHKFSSGLALSETPMGNGRSRYFVRSCPRYTAVKHDSFDGWYKGTLGWAEKRRERLELDGYRCAVCGSGLDVDVYHKTYMHHGVEPISELVTLCARCALTHRAPFCGDAASEGQSS